MIDDNRNYAKAVVETFDAFANEWTREEFEKGGTAIKIWSL